MKEISKIEIESIASAIAEETLGFSDETAKSLAFLILAGALEDDEGKLEIQDAIGRYEEVKDLKECETILEKHISFEKVMFFSKVYDFHRKRIIEERKTPAFSMAILVDFLNVVLESVQNSMKEKSKENENIVKEDLNFLQKAVQSGEYDDALKLLSSLNEDKNRSNK